jgi:hypothetical protein
MDASTGRRMMEKKGTSFIIVGGLSVELLLPLAMRSFSDAADNIFGKVRIFVCERFHNNFTEN